MEELRYEYSNHRQYDEQNPNGYINANYTLQKAKKRDQNSALLMALYDEGYTDDYFDFIGECPVD